jgi:hypothetical protein
MRPNPSAQTPNTPAAERAPWSAVALALAGGLVAAVALSSLGPLIG